MSEDSELGRKERILDAAEHAFADFGFEGASLRHIVLTARVNLATVYYYFNSKEGLMMAVLDRRFDPMIDEHLQLLKAVEAKAQGNPLVIEDVLRAMLLPPLTLAKSTNDNGPIVRRLIGRLLTEPNDPIQKLLNQQCTDVRGAYLDAFRRSLPHLSEADLQWRFESIWGAISVVLCNPRKIADITGGICNPDNPEDVLAHLIPFFSAGLRAPAALKS